VLGGRSSPSDALVDKQKVAISKLSCAKKRAVRGKEGSGQDDALTLLPERPRSGHGEENIVSGAIFKYLVLFQTVYLPL